MLILTEDKHQRFCSQECNGKYQGRYATPEFKFRRSQLGGVASGKVRKVKRDRQYSQWIEKYGALEAIRRAYALGYHAGHRSRPSIEVSEAMKHVMA